VESNTAGSGLAPTYSTNTYEVPFTRDANGTFSFGDPVEVMRKTIWVPKPVQKAAEAPDDQVEVVKEKRSRSMFSDVI
jgi:hypothetical protein